MLELLLRGLCDHVHVARVDASHADHIHIRAVCIVHTIRTVRLILLILSNPIFLSLSLSARPHQHLRSLNIFILNIMIMDILPRLPTLTITAERVPHHRRTSSACILRPTQYLHVQIRRSGHHPREKRHLH